MARGAWGPAAATVAALYNVNRAKKSDPRVTPDELNPFVPTRAQSMPRAKPSDLW